MATDQASLIANAGIIPVSIEKLHLDTGNVRYKHVGRKLAEHEVEELIKQDTDTFELCEQILAAKFVYEPLVINSDYLVLEGNRRLVCLRMLRAQATRGELEGITSEQFNKVNCRMLPDKVEEKAIDLYLATIHVKGKMPWKLFNRAKHIYRLNTIHGISYDELAERLGMSKVTIQRNVRVYKILLGYSRKYTEDKEWYRKFTYYDELFKRKELKELRESDAFLNQFGGWVSEGKFHDVRDVRKLLKVVNDTEALKALAKENFQAALRILEANDPTITDLSFKKLRDAITILQTLRRTEFEAIINNQPKYELLVELEAEARKLLFQLDTIQKASRRALLKEAR